MAVAKQPFLTPEQYLEIERKAETKSEYLSGQMFAMSGASRNHVLIATNIAIALGLQLRDAPCEVYSSDMRVLVESKGLYTYPDVSVVCEEPVFADSELDTLVNPLILVEVLSPSTESYDRGQKFKYYRGIESLREYVLVSQSAVDVERYTRQGDGIWTLSEAETLDATINLASVDAHLQLADIYRKVSFAPASPGS